MLALLKTEGATRAGLTISELSMTKELVQIVAEVIFTGESDKAKIFGAAMSATPVNCELQFEFDGTYRGWLAVTKYACKGTVAGEQVYNLTFVGKVMPHVEVPAN